MVRDLIKDARLKALHPGWRISAAGNRYWEARPNRADKNRKKKI